MGLHKINSSLLSKEVTVALIGAGGTGSQVLVQLAKLHAAMCALGHPSGLHVTVWDDDVVSNANVARQAYHQVDVGTLKAATLVNRVNHAFNLDWTTRIERVTEKSVICNDIVIGCVDNRLARLSIHNACSDGAYYIDCGNKEDTGQVILGEICHNPERSKPDRLPHALELFPDLANPELDSSDEVPSCSLADALHVQSLMINTLMAVFAVNLLSELFRHGQINHHGYFVDSKSGRVNPLAIDPEVWKRLGYQPNSMLMAA